METHEAGSADKARILCERFKNSFKCITFTVHTVTKKEAKGKASNVSYAVERF